MGLQVRCREVKRNDVPQANGHPGIDKYLEFIDDSGTVEFSFLAGANGTQTALAGNAALGSGGVQTVYSISKTLTDAQIKALPTTTIELLPAPGAGKIVMPVSVIMRLVDPVSIYTNIKADTVIAICVGASNYIMKLDETIFGAYVSGLLGDSGDMAILSPITYVSGSITCGTSGYYADQLINQNINIMSISEANFTGGNAANTLQIDIAYVLYDYS